MPILNRNGIVLFKSMLITCMSAITSFYISGIVVLATQSYIHTYNKSISVDLEISIYSVLTHFFLFMFLSISPWFLFSKFLPRSWMFSSFITALFAGLLISVRNYFIVEKYPLMALYLRLFDTSILGGFLVAIPQWILLKKSLVQKNYYWLIVNLVGWGIVGLIWMQQLPLSYVLMGKVWGIFFDFVQNYRVWGLVELCSFLPLGIGIGLFFIQLETKDKQIKSASPVVKSEQENVQT